MSTPLRPSRLCRLRFYPQAWSAALLILLALTGGLALADSGGVHQESAVTPDFGMMVRYVFWALIAVTGVAVAALLWSWLLGRRVAQRTRQLQRELSKSFWSRILQKRRLKIISTVILNSKLH